jgi:hypothetical protein
MKTPAGKPTSKGVKASKNLFTDGSAVAAPGKLMDLWSTVRPQLTIMTVMSRPYAEVAKTDSSTSFTNSLAAWKANAEAAPAEQSFPCMPKAPAYSAKPATPPSRPTPVTALKHSPLVKKQSLGPSTPSHSCTMHPSPSHPSLCPRLRHQQPMRPHKSPGSRVPLRRIESATPRRPKTPGSK